MQQTDITTQQLLLLLLPQHRRTFEQELVVQFVTIGGSL